MTYDPSILYITEEHFAKGCYHYYDNYQKIGYTVWGFDRRSARQKLRERYPDINHYKVKFILR